MQYKLTYNEKYSGDHYCPECRKLLSNNKGEPGYKCWNCNLIVHIELIKPVNPIVPQ